MKTKAQELREQEALKREAAATLLAKSETEEGLTEEEFTSAKSLKVEIDALAAKAHEAE